MTKMAEMTSHNLMQYTKQVRGCGKNHQTGTMDCYATLHTNQCQHTRWRNALARPMHGRPRQRATAAQPPAQAPAAPAAVAARVVSKLREVLAERVGRERPPPIQFRAERQIGDRIAPAGLARRKAHARPPLQRNVALADVGGAHADTGSAGAGPRGKAADIVRGAEAGGRGACIEETINAVDRVVVVVGAVLVLVVLDAGHGRARKKSNRGKQVHGD